GGGDGAAVRWWRRRGHFGRQRRGCRGHRGRCRGSAASGGPARRHAASTTGRGLDLPPLRAVASGAPTTARSCVELLHYFIDLILHLDTHLTELLARF